jgi:hypothetical protein
MYKGRRCRSVGMVCVVYAFMRRGGECFETKQLRRTSCVYNESMNSINDFRRRNARLLMLAMGSSASPPGQGGRTSVGSISFAPRATILPMVVDRFCCMVLSCGTGGAISGVAALMESPPRDFGLISVEARRSFLGLAKLAEPSIGAVMGVVGVIGVDGARPLMRVSYVFFTGEMAILASESFIEIDRNRLWAAGFLMRGDAALLVEFS